MKYIFLFIAFVSISSACSSDKTKLDNLSWLEGTWKAEVEGNDVIENWRKDNDTSWIGESAFVKDGKTLFTEVMAIRVEKGKMVFISAVSNQNDAEEVKFTESSWTDNKIVFENKKHDFPQKITYELKSEGNMLAFISGDLNGMPKRIDFNFKKIK